MARPNLPRSCGVILLCEQPTLSFLLMRHHDRWDLPKGHVDPGETDLECALREMEEETGIMRSDVQIDEDFLYVQTYEVPAERYAGGKKGNKTVKSLLIYLGWVEYQHTVEITEHVGCRWFPWMKTNLIQERTIDPLLKELSAHFQGQFPSRKPDNRSNQA